MNRAVVVFLFIFSFVFPLTAAAQSVAFVGVNVIPMDRERVLLNQTVVVRNGLIAEIGGVGKVKVPKDAVRVDGKGKYLVPGLVDMHTHLLSDGEFPDSIAEDELRVMVANGVTTIRFMIGTPELLELRARSAKGEINAPTIYVASPHLTGREQGNNFVVNTPDEAREAVRTSKTAGYDFIKVTTFIKAEVYEAAVDEAAKQNIRVVGHADSRFVGLDRAWKAKQQIEHLDGYMEMLMKSDAPVKGSVSDMYIYNPDNWKSFDHMDESKINDVARKTVASNPYVNPTQHFMKNTFGVARSEESIRAQPDFKFYPPKVQRQWLEFYKKNRFLNTISLKKRARWVELRNKLIKAIHDAGGKIMAGSDTPEFLFLYGFSQHRELKALADAGLSNYAALAAGTRNAHEFFGTIDKVGTIERGKRADLILLNANPLENISAAENRDGVMLKGKWYAQSELNGWLDEIAPKIAGSLEAEERRAATEIEKLGGKVEWNADREVVKVDLNNAKIADADLRHLEKFTELEWLDVRVTPIGDAGAAHLSNLRKLKFLNISRTSLSDKGLASLRRLTELETLFLGTTKVTDEGLKNIELFSCISWLSCFCSDRDFTHNVERRNHETHETHERNPTTPFTEKSEQFIRRQMKIFIAVGVTLILAVATFGQTDDKKAVLGVVNELFAQMRAANPAGILATGTADNQLVAVRKLKDGKTRIDVINGEAFTKFFTKADAVEEVMYAPNVEMSGDWAMVWGRYVFFVGDKLSHCGINQFNLVRTDAGWKIANGASTIDPGDCNEKEKAMKSSLPKPTK